MMRITSSLRDRLLQDINLHDIYRMHLLYSPLEILEGMDIKLFIAHVQPRMCFVLGRLIFEMTWVMPSLILSG